MFLLAEIAGTEIALPSETIESIVTVSEVVSAPRCDPVVAGLFAMRSRVLTLIDCQYHVTGRLTNDVKGRCAAIVGVGGHSFGLLLDRVHDVVLLGADAALPAGKLGPGWSGIVCQLIQIDGRMVMVVDPEALVGPRRDVLAA